MTKGKKIRIKHAQVDPTPNVKALVAARALTMRDERKSDRRYFDAALKNHKESDALGHHHLKEMADLRADYTKEIRASDLNAAEKTRQVDVLAGASSAAGLATAVSALQATSDRNAETLRNQLNATAATMAKQTADTAAATQLQTDNLFRRTDERVAALERAAATGAGRQSATDPQMVEFMGDMKRMLATQAVGSGKSEQTSDSMKAVMAFVTLILAALSIGSFVYSANRTPAATSTPQIVYVPTPAPTVVSTTPVKP